MIVYTAKERTSLAVIAQQVHRSDRHPIFNYNTKVKQNFRSNSPDDPITAGTVILIPMTAKEYDHVIETMEAMKQRVSEDMTLTLRELNEAKQSADKWGKGVDFIADIATIVAGPGKKALQFTGIVRRQQLEKLAIEALQKTTALLGHYDEAGKKGEVADKATESLAKQALKQKTSTLMSGAGKEFGKEMGKLLVEKGVKYRFGETAGLLAELVLEGHPSAAAQLYLRVKTGELPEVTFKRAASAVHATTDNSLRRLAESVKRLRAEKELVYGKASTPTPLSPVAH